MMFVLIVKMDSTKQQMERIAHVYTHVRVDKYVIMPNHVHLLLIVDRDSGKVHLSYDFGDFITAEIPEALKNSSFDGIGSLHLGQDGTGTYSCDLPATVDELMIFGGALSEGEIAALAEYYGKE